MVERPHDRAPDHRDAEIQRLRRECEELRTREQQARAEAEGAKRRFRDFVRATNRFASSIRAGADERRRSRRRLRVQYAIGGVLAQTGSLEEAAPRIFEIFHEALGWEAGILWISDGDALRCARVWRAAGSPLAEGFEGECRRTTFAPGEGLPGRVWDRNEPVWVEDVAEGSGDPLLERLARRDGMGGACAFPIRDGRFTGVMELLSRESRSASESTFHLTNLVGYQIGQFAERRRAEEERDSSRRLFQGIAETTPNVLYLYDLIEDRNAYVNPAVERILGYTPEEVQALGSLVPALLHPDDAPAVAENAAAFDDLKDGEVCMIEYRMRHADGTCRWLRSHETVFSRTPEGRAHQVLGVAQDVTGQKESERRLRESEERLRLATEAGCVGIVEWDLQTDESRCSDVLAEIYGYAPGTYNPTYEEFLEKVHPEDRGWVRGTLDAAVAAGAPHELEFRIVRPDGEVRQVRAKGRVHQDAAGKPVRMVGITLDVTDRKRAEDERDRLAREAEAERARLETVLQQMPDGVVVADASGRLLMGNEAAGRIHGQPIEPVESIQSYKRWEALRVDGSPLPPERYPLARALGGEPVAGEEYRIPRPDGTERVIIANAAPLQDFEGGVDAAVVAFTDITELRRAQERLTDQKRFFETTLQQAADAIIVSDTDGRLTFVNAAARRMALLEPAGDPAGTTPEITPEVWGRAHNPDGQPVPVVERSLTRALRGETTTGREARMVRSDGSFYDILISAAPVLGADGRVTGAVASFADITGHKRAQEDRLRLSALEAAARAEADERNRISRELHDRVAHSVGVVHQSLQLHDALVESRPAAAREKLDLSKELTRTALETTRNLSAELRRSETERGLGVALRDLLKVAVPPRVRDELHVSGDETRLPEHLLGQVYQILREAVRNAVRHSGCGRLRLELDVGAGEVRGSVEDDGRGFEKDGLAAGEANGEVNGEAANGLGIRSMRERAALVDGSLDIFSGPGSGTRVEVRIPLNTGGG